MLVRHPSLGSAPTSATTPTSERRRLLPTLLVALVGLVSLGLSAAPAGAATKPAKVSLVTFTAASPTSLTVTWPKTSNATKYEVFVWHTYAGVLKAKARASTTKTSYTATRLAVGTTYWFQVRALNGSTAGSRSSRSGHMTISAQGRPRGPIYKVMTHNLCTRACMTDNGPGSSSYYPYYKWSARMPGATERITTIRPDVLMLQEAECAAATDRPLMVPPAGYAMSLCKSAKQLYYRTARFDLAATDYIFLGEHGGGNRYAVWAELIDKTAADKHVIFVSVHLVTGTSNTAAAERKAEVKALVNGIKAINPNNLPVVYGGDFNSHKGRTNDTVATEFHANGFYDSFDQAEKLAFQHHNSYNDFRTTPPIGVTWGDHVDHVWIDPRVSRTLGWSNGARFAGTKYASPIPSDHSPIVAAIQVN